MTGIKESQNTGNHVEKTLGSTSCVWTFPNHLIKRM